MTDRVLFQTDDALSEANLWRALDRSNATDYVELGLDVIPTWADGEVTIGAGVAFIRDVGNDIGLVVRADERTVSLADSGGDNWVHLVVDGSGQDVVEIDVRADESAPSGPSLLLAEADAAAETVTERNRLPHVQSREPTDAEDVARKAETDALESSITSVDSDLSSHVADVGSHDDVDVAAFLRGPYSDRPGAGDVDAGTWFQATDRSILFESDGQSWYPIAGVGSADNPVPGTTQLESLKVTADADLQSAALASGTVAKKATQNNDIPRYDQVLESGAENIVQAFKPTVTAPGTFWTQFLYGYTYSGTALSTSTGPATIFDPESQYHIYAPEEVIGIDTTTVDSDQATDDWYFSDPLITNRRTRLLYDSDGIYFGTVGSSNGDGRIWSLNKTTGTERWRYSPVGDPVSIELDSGFVYYGDSQDYYGKLDVLDGSSVFRSSLTNTIESRIGVGDGKMYLCDDAGEFYALSTTDGSTEWTFTPDAACRDDVFYHDGGVYFADDNGASSKFYKLNSADGTLEWDINAGYASDIAYDAKRDRIVFAAAVPDGSLRWVDPSTGDLDFAISSNNNEEPTSFAFGENNEYVVVTESGTSLFDISNQSEIWRYTNGNRGVDISIEQERIFQGRRALSLADGTTTRTVSHYVTDGDIWWQL